MRCGLRNTVERDADDDSRPRVPLRQREARFHGRSGHAMKSFPIVSWGVVAGYAAKEFENMMGDLLYLLWRQLRARSASLGDQYAPSHSRTHKKRIAQGNLRD